MTVLFGGPGGDRTHDLRIANAALSQLSYGPGNNGNRRSGFQSPKRFPDLVEHTGLEPVTSTMPLWRAPNCANAPVFGKALFALPWRRRRDSNS